jgi:hypothetical protein
MPANHSLWSDDPNRVHHARTETIEPDEGQPVSIGQPEAPRRTSAQYVHLMAENEILSFEPTSRLHQRHQPMQQQFDHPKHAADDDTIRDFASQFVPDEVFGSDS